MAPSVHLVLIEENAPVSMRLWREVAEGLRVLRIAGVSASTTVVQTPAQREAVARGMSMYAPDVVFVLVGRCQSHAAHALLFKLRPRNLRPVIAVGGPLGTLDSDSFSFHPSVNAVVLGHWPRRLLALAGQVSQSGSGADIPGVWWRGSGGWQVAHPPAIEPGDAMPPAADFEGLPIAGLLKINGGCLPLRASSGCNENCGFCEVPLLRALNRPTPQVSTRPPSEVAEEARSLVSRWGAKRFEFVDDLFPSNRAWLEQFRSAWLSGPALPFRWTWPAERASAEALRILAQAGGEVVDFGLETGDNAQRRSWSSRNSEMSAIAEARNAARETGIRVAVHVLLGLPRTRPEANRATLKAIEQLEPDELIQHVYSPWPRKENWADVSHSELEVHGEVIRGSETHDTVSRPDAAEIKLLSETRRQLAVEDIRCRVRAMNLEPGDGGRVPLFPLLPAARQRSPLPLPVRVDRFHASNGSADVLAMRIPTEVEFEVDAPRSPALRFGILMQPSLPGMRSPHPVAFSVKVEQDGKTWRIFQKVLIQSLDPDSRLWHRFRVPMAGIQPGLCRIALESTLCGKGARDLPPDGPLWAGWSELIVEPGSSRDQRDSMDEPG